MWSVIPVAGFFSCIFVSQTILMPVYNAAQQFISGSIVGGGRRLWFCISYRDPFSCSVVLCITLRRSSAVVLATAVT